MERGEEKHFTYLWGSWNPPSHHNKTNNTIHEEYKEYHSVCDVVWFRATIPRKRVYASYSYMQGVERQREGISHGKGGVRGGPNHTTAQKLWYSIYYAPFTENSVATTPDVQCTGFLAYLKFLWIRKYSTLPLTIIMPGYNDYKETVRKEHTPITLQKLQNM